MVDFEIDIKNCIEVLKQNGTILYPTDTVWGIGCDAKNETAIKKVFAIKKRPHEKALIVLVADAKDILDFVATPPPDIIDIVEQFIEPTTIIFEHGIDLPECVLSESGSVAIRVVTDLFCKALIKRLGSPIVSTSANFSGQPTPICFKDIDEKIKREVNYVVLHQQLALAKKKPSRIVKIDDEANIEVIRN